jgi:PAS domain S-box-containing protein
MSAVTRLRTDALQLAFALSPVGLCVTEHRMLTLCNPAFGRMFGWDEAELLGQPLAPLYPSLQEYEDIGRQGLPVMEACGTYSDERIMRRRDGSLFWCHVAGQALDRAAPFACAVWMFEDLSARRPLVAPLTAREREVARAVMGGLTSKAIGRQLGISPRTVEAHRARLMKKLGAATQGELLARLAGASGPGPT